MTQTAFTNTQLIRKLLFNYSVATEHGNWIGATGRMRFPMQMPWTPHACIPPKKNESGKNFATLLVHKTARRDLCHWTNVSKRAKLLHAQKTSQI